MSGLAPRLSAWFRQNLGWENTPRASRERFALLVWCGALAIVLGFGNRMAAGVQIGAWAALVLSLAALLSNNIVHLFGPVLFYDLVRVARRGRYAATRLAYAIILLLVLTSLYVWWTWKLPKGQELDAQEVTRFAESFFLIFMAAEFLVVLLLTPAYVAGAIADEKDRGTLDYLLATDLRNREIVLSKLVARLANLALLVLTGLPILSLTQFFGGIDPNLVLTGFAALGLTMTSLACLSILHSTYARKPRDAIVFTYLSAAVYLGLSYALGRWTAGSKSFAAWSLTGDEGTGLTIGLLAEAFTSGNLFVAVHQMLESWRSGQPLTVILPGLLRSYAVFHAVVACCCVLWAVARLRVVEMKQVGKDVPRARTWRKRRIPPVGDTPMVWREVFIERGFHFDLAARIVLGLLILISFAPAAEMLLETGRDLMSGRGMPPNWRGQLALNMSGWVQQAGTLVACLTLVGVAVRAAGSISGERDRDTLDGLLLTPLRRDDILYGKWVGSILGMRWAWLWLMGIWTLGIATGGLHFLALPLLLLAWLVFATFAANLGLFFSIVCKTSLQAIVATFLGLVAVCFGHWLAWSCCLPVFIYSSGNQSEFPDWVASFQVYGMTPPWTLRALAFYGPELQEPVYAGYRSMTNNWERFSCALVGVVCWGVISIGLGWVTAGRFRRATSGEPAHPSEFPGGAHPLQSEPTAEENVVLLSGEHEVPMATPVEIPVADAVMIEERREPGA